MNDKAKIVSYQGMRGIAFSLLESKKFCTAKKPGDSSRFLTYPVAFELFA